LDAWVKSEGVKVEWYKVLEKLEVKSEKYELTPVVTSVVRPVPKLAKAVKKELIPSEKSFTQLILSDFGL
jgi:hypothetical protein